MGVPSPFYTPFDAFGVLGYFGASRLVPTFQTKVTSLQFVKTLRSQIGLAYFIIIVFPESETATAQTKKYTEKRNNIK